MARTNALVLIALLVFARCPFRCKPLTRWHAQSAAVSLIPGASGFGASLPCAQKQFQKGFALPCVPCPLGTKICRSAALNRARSALRSERTACTLSISTKDSRTSSKREEDSCSNVFSNEIVVGEASEQDITAIAQVSMDAFYGRPWTVGKSLPWIETEASGLFGVLARARMLLKKYSRPVDAPGQQYRGFEYVWSRKLVEDRLKISTKAAPTEGTSENMRVAKAVDVASGKVVGAVELIMLPYPASPSPRKPYLFNLCVDPKYRIRGIGRTLMYWCEFAAREWGFDELFLHVERDDIRKLYNSYGYAETYLKPSSQQHKSEVPLDGVLRHYSAIKQVTGAEDEDEIQRALSAEDGWLIMHRSLILDEDVAEVLDTTERESNDAVLLARN